MYVHLYRWDGPEQNWFATSLYGNMHTRFIDASLNHTRQCGIFNHFSNLSIHTAIRAIRVGHVVIGLCEHMHVMFVHLYCMGVGCVCLCGELQGNNLNSKEECDKEKLKLHLNGVLCFGGPIPLATYLSKTDIANDPNLTAHTIMDFLRRSYEALENNPNLPWSWPEVLYVQMDNANNTNKNSDLFNFFAMLVWRGVFRKIKVGFELTGHTHDIIDQVFSRISGNIGIRDIWSFREMEKSIQASYTVMCQDNEEGKQELVFDAEQHENRVEIEGCDSTLNRNDTEVVPEVDEDEDEDVTEDKNGELDNTTMDPTTKSKRKRRTRPLIGVLSANAMVVQLKECVLLDHWLAPYCKRLGIIHTILSIRTARTCHSGMMTLNITPFVFNMCVPWNACSPCVCVCVSTTCLKLQTV